MKLYIGRAVPVLVICAVCVFGAVGCKKAVARGSRVAVKQLPKVKEAAKDLLKEGAKQAAEEGAKKAAPEVYKYGKKKLSEYKNNNNPAPVIPLDRRYNRPPDEIDKERMRQMYRNWKALQSDNSNQQFISSE
jgi:hypothetical protein